MTSLRTLHSEVRQLHRGRTFSHGRPLNGACRRGAVVRSRFESAQPPSRGVLDCAIALAITLYFRQKCAVLSHVVISMKMTIVENNVETTRHGGVTGAGFTPGMSGNPGGCPKGLARRVRELVGDDGHAIARVHVQRR